MNDEKTPIQLDDQLASRMAELFRALSDPSRLKIIAALCGGGTNVGGIAKMVGISESAVSHQLRTLRQMRLVRAHRKGREVFYTLDDDHVTDLFMRGYAHSIHA